MQAVWIAAELSSALQEELKVLRNAEFGLEEWVERTKMGQETRTDQRWVRLLVVVLVAASVLLDLRTHALTAVPLQLETGESWSLLGTGLMVAEGS